MPAVFSNNSEAVLRTALLSGTGATSLEVTFELNGEGYKKFPFSVDLSPSKPQHATLTNKDMPGEYEIVMLMDYTAGALGAGTFTVVRASEDTSALAWPIGTILDARVTAWMLKSFVQADETGVIHTAGHFVVNSSRAISGDIIQIAGWPVLQLTPAKPVGGLIDSQDNNLSHESVGGSRVISLGPTPAWVADTYYSPHSIVKPPTPNGFQYVLHASGGLRSLTTPLFGAGDEVVDAYIDANIVGKWVPTPDPAVFNIAFRGFTGSDLVVSEVGFICLEHGGGSAPVISIGTPEEPARYVSAQPLSQITESKSVHRFPISAGGKITDQLKFTLVTPSSSAYVGKLYWRGFFVETL